MKVLKVLGILFALLVAAGVGAYFVFLHAPSIEAQCDHIVPIMEAHVKEKAGGDEQLAKAAQKAAKFDRATCLSARKPPEFGRWPYVKESRCMMDATTFEQIAACEKMGK